MIREPFNRHILHLLPLVAAAAALTTAALALPAHAEALVDYSDSPQIRAGQVVDGSAYVAGNDVTVAGTVKGDLFCAGNTVTITGTVEGDILCASNNLSLTGSTTGDVRLAGNNVNLGGTTTGSATLGGNNITTSGGSMIGRDLTVGGNLINLGGAVTRDVRAGAQTATIAGTVGRDVDGELAHLTVTEGAKITGHLHYVSDTDASVAPGSVQGDVQRTPVPDREVYRGPTAAQWFWIGVFWIAGFVVLSLLVALVLPRYVRSTTAPDWGGWLKALLVGVVAVLLSGPASLILFVTVIGIVAAKLLWTALTFGLMAGAVLSAYFLGRSILRGRETTVVGTTALGAVILGVISVIPVAGQIILLLAACAGLGMIVLGLRSQHEPRAVSGYPAPPVPPGPLGPAYMPGPHDRPMQPRPGYHPGPQDRPMDEPWPQAGPKQDAPAPEQPPQDGAAHEGTPDARGPE